MMVNVIAVALVPRSKAGVAVASSMTIRLMTQRLVP